jgi:hypothetical protein
MADAPAPTYRVENVDGADRYVCIIPYMGKEGDICGHWSTDRELFIQHTFLAHNGDLVQEGAPNVAPQAQTVAPQAASAAPRAGQAAATPAASAAPKE